MIAEWKCFCAQVELLLVGGPYTGMEEKQKVTTLLNWMTDKGQKIYKEQLIFPTEEPNKKDKDKLKDVLQVFEAHFTPLQSMIHSWYNLGALHSHHCKDQADFMSRLHSLSNNCAFTNADEVVKFLFLIHNSHKRVQDQILKDVTKNSSLTDCLLSVRRVEAHIQTEKLAHKMHNDMSDSVSVDAFKKSNLVEAVARELAVVMAEAVEVAEVATNTNCRVVTATHHQADKASAVTVVHCILRGNVLRTDKTVTPVVRLVTTVDTVSQSKDHQCLAENPVERCMSLNQMKNTNTILSRSSAK